MLFYLPQKCSEGIDLLRDRTEIRTAFRIPGKDLAHPAQGAEEAGIKDDLLRIFDKRTEPRGAHIRLDINPAAIIHRWKEGEYPAGKGSAVSVAGAAANTQTSAVGRFRHGEDAFLMGKKAHSRLRISLAAGTAAKLSAIRPQGCQISEDPKNAGIHPRIASFCH